MKGIILSGGTGSRLGSLTKVVSKQLLPVYDKPIIFYPLSTMIHAGVTELLVISSQEHIKSYEKLLGDGSQFGIEISYAQQTEPRGIPDSLLIGRDFIAEERFWLILGDNLFHGPEFGHQLRQRSVEDTKSLIFGYHVKNPEDFGVVIFDAIDGGVKDLVEKPSNFLSNWAIPGMYLLDATAVAIASNLQPSMRGEIEIIDLLRHLQEMDLLRVRTVSRGNAWFDLGTPDSLLRASNFVQTIQTTQGLKVGDPLEAALNSNLIGKL